MREMNHSELKQIQLDVLDVLHEFCVSNGLRYSISNGTLIGSVIYGGYIPWDDDIDVTMPREDYDRLLKEFPEVYHGSFRLGAMERYPLWDRFYAKIWDDRTLMKENRSDAVETGVNVDIFPADAIPEDDIRLKEWQRRRLMIHRIFELKERALLAPRAWWKTVLLLPVKLMLLPFGKRWLCEMAERQARRWNGEVSGDNCCSLVNGYHLTHPYSAGLFDSLEETSFEGHICKRFTGYDEYLRAGYGNYLKEIPEDKQVSHHCFKAYYKDLNGE